MDDLISRAAVVGAIKAYWKKVVDDIPKDTEFEEVTRLCDLALEHNAGILKAIDNLPSAQPDLSSYSDKLWRNAYERGKAEAQAEIIRCGECKHNPKYEWFGCPMSHLNEKQRPETAWCWKGERRTDGVDS